MSKIEVANSYKFEFQYFQKNIYFIWYNSEMPCEYCSLQQRYLLLDFKLDNILSEVVALFNGISYLYYYIKHRQKTMLSWYGDI